MDVLELIKNNFGKEIKDSEIKADKTWSSEKIDIEIKTLKQSIDTNKTSQINSLNNIINIL